VVVFFLAIAIALLLLNGFFVLAEFAAVKMRPSRVQELIEAGERRALSVKVIQDRLDEYLSVCQVGITFASIGLGFVAEPAIVRLIEPVLLWTGLFPAASSVQWFTAHGIAFTISYMLVSFLHILLGELIPKSLALRLTERACLLTAKPLRTFRWLFAIPLWFLNGSATALLRWFNVRGVSSHHQHSEDELRILMIQSQEHGLMTFRRLLYLENVFDLGELKVRDAMRPRSQVRCLRMEDPWEDNLQVARNYRHTRYPLIDGATVKPRGIIHLKDLLLTTQHEPSLLSLVRPIITIREDALLESLLSEMQKRRIHVAMVENSQGEWIGFLTLEDVIEEIVGTIRDEFEDEDPISLADSLSLDGIQLGVEAEGTVEAVRIALSRMKPDSLPVPKERVLRAIEERELVVETYLGRNLGMPHARLTGLQKPIVLFIRSERGIPYRGTQERANLLMVLLTPAGQPRVHQRLQAIVATLFDESEYVPERLRTATTASQVYEILCTGEQATLD
jgi:CBS domain containing-hemolysin-like protein